MSYDRALLLNNNIFELLLEEMEKMGGERYV